MKYLISFNLFQLSFKTSDIIFNFTEGGQYLVEVEDVKEELASCSQYL
jgi:hypothetical protein